SPVGAMAKDGPPSGTPNSALGRATERMYVQLVIALAVKIVFQRPKVAASVARGLTITSAPSAPRSSDPSGRLISEQTWRPTRILKRSEEHTSELQSRSDLVCRLLLEKKKKQK